MTKTVTSQVIATAMERTPRAILRRATMEGWPYRKKIVQGGKKHFYYVEMLPQDVRDRLLAVESQGTSPDAMRFRDRLGLAWALVFGRGLQSKKAVRALVAQRLLSGAAQ